jgi:hypothetical protein
MDNISLLLGNGCSLLATLSNMFASTRKTARSVLLVQSVGQAFYFACALFLKAPSGAVQNAVSIVRNFVAMGKKKSSKWVEWALIAAAVVLGVAFNNRGIAGWLPIVGNLEYSLAVFRYRDDQRMLKAALVVSLLFFIVFNVIISNYVGVVADSVVVGFVTVSSSTPSPPTGSSAFKPEKTGSRVSWLPRLSRMRMI